MIQHVRLVVAQVADRVLPKMRIIERQHLQPRKTIQVQCFLERTDLIPRDVQILQRFQTIQRHPNRINQIAGYPELLQISQLLQGFKFLPQMWTNTSILLSQIHNISNLVLHSKPTVDTIWLCDTCSDFKLTHFERPVNLVIRFSFRHRFSNLVRSSSPFIVIILQDTTSMPAMPRLMRVKVLRFLKMLITLILDISSSTNSMCSILSG